MFKMICESSIMDVTGCLCNWTLRLCGQAETGLPPPSPGPRLTVSNRAIDQAVSCMFYKGVKYIGHYMELGGDQDMFCCKVV